ncbi:melanization protease 1-like [Armigeres subalbatus]|uniref:melanization protease 1-like n=1 Tax=Armigeres subalbatus TaxID=124917 RepID=UPI002ED47534
MKTANGFWLLCCVLAISKRAKSQMADDCLTDKARKGKCVPIEDCPALSKIAYKSAISEVERRYLKAHSCGFRKVCCEKPLEGIATTTTATVPVEPDEKSTDVSQSVDIANLLPNGKKCGLDSAGHRIFGGDITEKDQFPWTVALDYNLPRVMGVRCGGSLINTKYVLTAAHCVDNVQKQDITLRLGEWDLEQNPDCEETDDQDCNPDVMIENVARIIIHPKYKNKVNDIALLRMEHSLPDEYTSHIFPICLPFSEELVHLSYTNKNVSVVGWGQTEKEIRSRYKMYAGLITISTSVCAEALEKQLNEEQICAESFTDTIRDTCGGDSGGPLQIQINGTYYLIGVVSYGPPCGRTSLPAVYTRVTAFMSWILDNITD